LAAASTAAQADQSEAFLDAGLGTFSTEGSSLSQVKFAKLGINDNIYHALVQRFSVGAWLDARGEGRTSSAFTGYQLGFAVKNDLMEMAIYSGPCLISSSDTVLGGHLQFNETIFVGVHDAKSGDSIGVAYNHFSSAGLALPNLGRDFMGLEIKFPLF
jgi:hypothetical protein